MRQRISKHAIVHGTSLELLLLQNVTDVTNHDKASLLAQKVYDLDRNFDDKAKITGFAFLPFISVFNL